MCEAASCTPSAREQLEHALVHRQQLRRRDLALRRRRLVGDAHQAIAGRCSARSGRRSAGRRRTSWTLSGDSARPMIGSGTSSLSTPSRSRNTAARPLTLIAISAYRLARVEAAGERLPVARLTASSGCDTSACQTTAWKDSTSGVRSSGGGSMRSRRLPARRAFRQERRPRHRSPRPRAWARSIALTRLTDTLCSREPPPTENTSIASRPARPRDLQPPAERALPAVVVGPRRELGDVVGRRVALDAQSLRKSLTACEAWPAPPPTPSTNRRPPRVRIPASSRASRSTCSGSTSSASYSDVAAR